MLDVVLGVHNGSAWATMESEKCRNAGLTTDSGLSGDWCLTCGGGGHCPVAQEEAEAGGRVPQSPLAIIRSALSEPFVLTTLLICLLVLLLATKRTSQADRFSLDFPGG